MNRKSDYIFHPPSGSEVPGKVEANPYDFYPPVVLREMLTKQPEGEDRDKMVSSLKKWERIYIYPYYPFRLARALRVVAAHIRKLGEITGPAINLPYYQDAETPQGIGEIIDSLRGLYDNDNAEKTDYARQGERPHRDIDTGEGDFLTPDEAIIGEPGSVKPRGDGDNPADTESVEPPTGGDIDRW